MIAGTLVQLDEPTDEPLDSAFGDGDDHLPALSTETLQRSFDDRPIQRGTAAGTVATTDQYVAVTVDGAGDPQGVNVERNEARERVATEWVADVTGTGLIAIESVAGEGELDFPLDLFYYQTGTQPLRLEVDVETLHVEWGDDDVLGDVWMRGADAGDGASIDYHARADADEPATIGLGFERPWNGTVERGVIYESGYIALFDETRPSAFIRFIAEEILPYAAPRDGGDEQATLDLPDPDEVCDRCGRETDTVDDTGYCLTCRDHIEEHGGDPATWEGDAA